MTIAIFTDTFAPQVNGIVTSVMSLAENLADRGHEVIIVAPEYKDSEEYAYPGVEVVRVYSVPAAYYDGFRWSPPYSYATYKILKNRKVDLVHFMTPIFLSLVGIKIARKLRVPLVGTFHTFIADPLYFEQLFNGPIKITSEITWKFLNLYYDAADHVTAPTEEAVRIIQDNGSQAQLEALSNGIDFSLIGKGRGPEAKEQYKLEDDVVLYVGRVAAEKNLKGLIDAFVLVQKTRPAAQLLIVGDGPYLEECQAYAQEQVCADRILFSGLIPRDELLKSGIFEASRVFATTSETETQGITILEAQAQGMACVGVGVGGVLNLIEDGKSGYLVSSGQTELFAQRVLSLLENPQLAFEMGAEAEKAVQVHQMDSVIDRWEEIYTDLIARNKTGELLWRPPIRMRTLLKFSRNFEIDREFMMNWFKRWLRFFSRASQE
ncbi:MAG: glycosyltransferase [Spirochaetales bacterium]|nr:glycosyltransferase [Spirochaetales bacterium]